MRKIPIAARTTFRGLLTNTLTESERKGQREVTDCDDSWRRTTWKMSPITLTILALVALA